MRENDFSRFAIKHYTITGRHFLRHITERGIRIEAVQPDDAVTYLRHRRQQYRRRNGRFPADETDWRSHYTSPIYTLLRLAQGAWPPPTVLESRVESFKHNLKQEHFRPGTVRQYLEQARLFLAYLERQEVGIEHAKPDIHRLVRVTAFRWLGRSSAGWVEDARLSRAHADSRRPPVAKNGRDNRIPA